MMMDFTKAQDQIAKIPNDGERRVGNLLLNMGFAMVDSNVTVLNSQSRRIGEIDLIFEFEDTLFLVEASTDKHSGSSKKLAFFSKWADPSNLAALKKQCSLGSQKIIRIYVDLQHTTPDSGSVEVENVTAPGKMNRVCYADDFEYFASYAKKIGRWSKNDFLDFVGHSARENIVKIDAIQYYIGDLAVFCFVERVDNLLRTCYISRRRTGDLGYQRTLKGNRVANISNNIEKGIGLSFPNSILINAPKLIDELKPPESCPAIVKINFPANYNTCRIIDGQHRLLGFAATMQNIQKEYYLPVIALQSINMEKEIETFIDINSKQQRMDSNLILLLKADLNWEKGSRGYNEKIAVRVAKRLSKTFFKNRIFFGYSDELKGNKITLTTLVTGMRNNEQIEDTVEKTLKKLSDLFKLMQLFLPGHSFAAGGYFGHNRGISVLFRLLRLLKRNFAAKTIHVSKEDFFKDLGEIFNSEFINSLDDYYGEGGSNAAATQIVERLQARYPKKYKDMQPNLTRLPRNKR